MHHHEPASFWFAMTRASHYASCLLLMCAFVFDRLLAGPTLRDVEWQQTWNRQVRSLVKWTLAAALLTGAWWFGLTAIAMSGLPPREGLALENLAKVWNLTHFGAVWKLRLAAWILTTIVFLVLGRTRLIWLALAGSMTLACTLAWSGHAMISEVGPWHMIADVLHIAICGIWPAGLVPLGMLIWRANVDPPSPGDCIRDLVRRFSTISLTAVAILAFTGVINARYLLGSPSNLLSTPYGRALLYKLAAFVAILALGAANRYALRRGNSASLKAVRINVTVEILLAIGVLVAVGYLGLIPPSAHAS